MGRRVSMATRREVLRVVRERYVGKSRIEKSRILGEVIRKRGVVARRRADRIHI